MRIRKLPLFLTAAFVITGIIIFAWPRSTSASIALDGDAAWFFRSCHDDQVSPVATWEVGLSAAEPGQKTVFVGVENAYPGYRLVCDLHFANSGDLLLAVKEIAVLNGNPAVLDVQAIEDHSEGGKVLRPCGFRPVWGTRPNNVPANCRSEIQLLLTVGEQAEENSRLAFAVQVKLEESAK
jgi:hypothetical protein